MPIKEVTPAKAPIPNTPKPTPTSSAPKPVPKADILKPALAPNIPKPTDPSAPSQKPIPKKTEYKYAGKETLSQIIGKLIPKQLIPTKKINTIFGVIFILVLIIAIFQFPFGQLMSGNIDLTIKIGYPWTFLELALEESDIRPIKPFGLIFDLLLYILLSYIIDVIISSILRNPFIQSKKEFKKRPTIFKNREPSIAEKATKKIAEKVSKKKI